MFGKVTHRVSSYCHSQEELLDVFLSSLFVVCTGAAVTAVRVQPITVRGIGWLVQSLCQDVLGTCMVCSMAVAQHGATSAPQLRVLQNRAAVKAGIRFLPSINVLRRSAILRGVRER